MKTITITNTDITTSQIVLGIMRMAALSPKEASQTLGTAYDNGITFIDSADIYGKGDSETIFGNALKHSNISRDSLFIQSKAGIINNNIATDGFPLDHRYDFSKEHLINSVNHILKRLQIDYLDSFLLHRPDPLMVLDEVAETFNILHSSGKVRYFGVSNFNPQQVEMLQSAVSQKLVFNQVQFSLAHSGMIDFGLHTNMEDKFSVNRDGGIIEYSRQHHITLQAWSPFQHGQIAGTFIDDPNYPVLNQKLEELGEKYGVLKNAIATAWILKHPAQIQVVLGTMTPKHIIDSVKGADVSLTNQEWYDLYFAAGHDLP